MFMRNDIKSILIVGPYYPRKCGIASHTYQLSKSMESKGVTTKTLAPTDCKSDYKENLIGGFRLLKLLKYKHFDRVNIHFVPEEYFYTGLSLKRFLNIFPLISLLIVFNKMKNIRIIIHEPPLTKYFFQKTILWRYLWKKVPSISFFTETEKNKFQSNMNIKFKKNQVFIEPVNKDFNIFSKVSKNEGRRKLKINSSKKIFLCIGFVGYIKGFDKIAKILKENNLSNSILYIVGSVRLDNDQKEKIF